MPSVTCSETIRRGAATGWSGRRAQGLTGQRVDGRGDRATQPQGQCSGVRRALPRTLERAPRRRRRSSQGPSEAVGRAGVAVHRGTVAHVVGARPNFMKAAPVMAALAAHRRRATAHPHRPALRRPDVGRVLHRPRMPDAGPEPRRRLGHPGRPDRGPPRRARGCVPSAPAGPRRRLRRRQLDAGRGARRGQAGHPGGACRGRPAQLRRHDARGDQPAPDRPAVRPAVRDQPRGLRQPDRDRRPRRAHPLRRQPDDRHAARQHRPIRPGRGAGGARPARALRGGHGPPAGQRRRPGPGRAHRDDAPRGRRARPGRGPAPSPRPADARGERPRRGRPAARRRAARLRRLRVARPRRGRRRHRLGRDPGGDDRSSACPA